MTLIETFYEDVFNDVDLILAIAHAKLISLAIKKGIKITPIPGVSAITTLLPASGLANHKFSFLGFFRSLF